MNLKQEEDPACLVGWFVSLLVCEEILLAGLCERKILFRLKIYDRLRRATAKRTGLHELGTRAWVQHDVRLKQEEDPNRYTRSWMVEVSEEVELKLLRESRWRSNNELVACSGSSITVVICR